MFIGDYLILSMSSCKLSLELISYLKVLCWSDLIEVLLLPAPAVNELEVFDFGYAFAAVTF